MSKATKLIIAIVVVAVIAGGAVLLSNSRNDSKNTGNSGNNQAAETIITYDANGFSPSEVTVSSGSTIKVVNQTDTEIEPASDPHPTHTGNPELNAGDIEPGKSKSFTITAKGMWGYHNHYNASQKGTIIVE